MHSNRRISSVQRSPCAMCIFVLGACRKCAIRSHIWPFHIYHMHWNKHEWQLIAEYEQKAEPLPRVANA